MKKELNYSQVLRRSNLLKQFFNSAFLSVASYPRLLLEVFIRKNFGIKYYSLASAITLTAFLVFWPFFADSIFKNPIYGQQLRSGFWFKYSTWYVFTLAFMYFAYQRWQEVKRNPSVFDFAKHSAYSGDINPRFFALTFSGKKFGIRSIVTFCEPVVFFLVGLLIYYFGQNLGLLLMFSSFMYGMSYRAAYQVGDDFIIGLIDEKIMTEELENAFINDLPADQTRGVRFYTHKPNSEEHRRIVADAMFEKDEPTYAI